MNAILNRIEQGQNHKILIEQLKALYQVTLPILASNLVISFALLYGLWDVASHAALIVWMSMMLSVIAIRSLLYFIYRHHIELGQTLRLIPYIVIGSAISGL